MGNDAIRGALKRDRGLCKAVLIAADALPGTCQEAEFCIVEAISGIVVLFFLYGFFNRNILYRLFFLLSRNVLNYFFFLRGNFLTDLGIARLISSSSTGGSVFCTGSGSSVV